MNDPRVEGGTYRSGYWGETYVVVRIVGSASGPVFRVKWADGHTTEHQTNWDARLDSVVAPRR